MALGICKNCKKEKEVTLSGNSIGLCKVCYKKRIWNPKLVECKRCKRMLPMHSKGLCSGCYNSSFHIDQVKAANAKKTHNIDYETYKEITKLCVLCNFDKIVELHHLDHNNKNSSRDNLVGVCPNHHKMIHNMKYQKEVYQQLKEKGFKVPEFNKNGEFFSRFRIETKKMKEL